MCNIDISIHSKYECTYFPLKPLLEAKINENFEGPGCFVFVLILVMKFIICLRVASFNI